MIKRSRQRVMSDGLMWLKQFSGLPRVDTNALHPMPGVKQKACLKPSTIRSLMLLYSDSQSTADFLNAMMPSMM